jgi:hypothetical protein
LAFPTTHNGVAIKASAVVEFIDDVLRKLENTTLGYGPVIRAALTNGPIPSMELRKFCYLSGGIVFSQLSNLLGAIDGKKDLLITNLGIQKFQPDRISILPSSILFVSRNHATVYRDGLQIAAAIAYGLGREIEQKD